MGSPSTTLRLLMSYCRAIPGISNPAAIHSCSKRAILLREMALGAERDPTKFWEKLAKLPAVTPSKRVKRILKDWLPDGTLNITFASRAAGVGSLGRPRYVALGPCRGGLVAREAKAWLPSAWGWSLGRPKDHAYAVRLLKRSVEERDPYYGVKDGWVVRRLGPHCGRIELAQFPKHRDVLKAMGRETANLHLGSPKQRAKVLRDLGEREPGWLLEAAQAMAKTTEQDWEAYRSADDGRDLGPSAERTSPDYAVEAHRHFLARVLVVLLVCRLSSRAQWTLASRSCDGVREPLAPTRVGSQHQQTTVKDCNEGSIRSHRPHLRSGHRQWIRHALPASHQ
jgi:hypothetical protein